MGLGICGYDLSSNADAGWLAGLGFGFGFCRVQERIGPQTHKGHRPLSILYDTLLCNIEDLRAIINRQAKWNVRNFSVPFLWSLLVKFVIPPVLLLMLIIKMFDEAFGAHSDYPSFYQGWRCFVGFMPWLLTAVGFVWPQVFDAFMPEDTDFSFGRISSFGSFKVFVETKRCFLFSPAEVPLFATAHGTRHTTMAPSFPRPHSSSLLRFTPHSTLLLSPLPLLSSLLRLLSCFFFASLSLSSLLLSSRLVSSRLLHVCPVYLRKTQKKQPNRATTTPCTSMGSRSQRKQKLKFYP